MTARPILFNAAMTLAILDERKTQTRRIAKSVRHPDLGNIFGPGAMAREPQHVFYRCCPYAQPGEYLWVRETVRAEELDSGLDGVRYVADGAFLPIENSQEAAGKWVDLHHYRGERGATVPSIHMPRWASRILLEVTAVRIERLQDISEHDAKAEGLSEFAKDGKTFKYGIPDADGLPGNDDHGWHWHEFETSPIDAYKKLWNKINGESSWDDNSWVWVVEFKVVEVKK